MEGYALVHIEAYAPMLESSCGGLHPDNGHKTSAQAYAPMLESSCGGLCSYNGKKHRRVPKRYALVCLEAYAPRLESGTAINAAIMLPRLATCMQSPNLARNHASEQPWKLYSSKLKPIRNASSAVVR